MSPAESRAFAELPYMQDAVAVGRSDEAAKDPAAPTPRFDPPTSGAPCFFSPLTRAVAQMPVSCELCEAGVTIAEQC